VYSVGTSAPRRFDTAPLATMSTPATAPETAAPVAPAAPAPSPAAAAPTLRGFLANLRTGATTGAELVAARAEATALRSDLSARDLQLAAAATLATAQAAQLSTFSAFFGLQLADLAGKDSAALHTILAEKINAAAIDQVASMGVPTAALPPVTAPDAAAEKTLSATEFSALSNDEKMKFSVNGGRIV
jgi:hypothetical protein